MDNNRNGREDRIFVNPADTQPLEDRALKAAAQFMGQELLPLLGVEGRVRRIAPTEQVYLEAKDFMEDFNYEMEDGTWRHLEFESDSITKEDLRRFRAYEAITSYYYQVEVTTCVVCSSRVKEIQRELTEGINTYRVQVIRMKDKDADKLIKELSHMKEVLNMTVLGQMIMQDGIEKGIEKGEERVNRLNQILAKANRTEDIVKASGDKEYQKKLFEEFQL